MRKFMQSFQKRQSIASRIVCFILVLAMVVTMVPSLGGGISSVKAAENEKNLTIHFMVPNNWNWGQPAIQFWGGTYEVTGNADGSDGTEIPGWGGAKGYFLTKGEAGEETTDYSLTVKGTFTGCQFLDFNNPGNNINPAYDAKLMQYTGETPQEVYYIQKDNVWSYYLDKEGNKPIPDLPETETTFLLVGSIPGMAWEASAEPNFVKSASDENVYSITLDNIPAGNYEYKILQDAAINGWGKPWAADDNNKKLEILAPAKVTLSLNVTDETKATDVTVEYVKDLVVDAPAQIKKGIEEELTTTGIYYAGDEAGSKEEVNVTYEAVSEGIQLDGNKLLVPDDYAGTEVIIKALYNDIVKEITIPVVEQIYTYTIYYYDFDETHMTTDAADLWLWEEGGAPGQQMRFSETEKLEDGNTWLKATITVPYTKLGIIARCYNSWDSWKTSDILYTNTDKTETQTLYLVSNKSTAYTTLPELTAPVERYIMVEYDRPEKDYTGWNIYTWNSGFGKDVTVDFKEMGGKMVAKIPVKESAADLKLSFCMRRSTEGDEWAEKDGGDHFVTIPADQTVVKAVFTQGEGITEVLPYNTGYEMDGANEKIHFYYRNDKLSAENNLASLTGKVNVVVEGEAYEMTYDAATDRFIYDLSDVTTRDYHYYYQVDGQNELDAFNSEKETYNEKECNVIHFKKPDVTVEASLSQASMDYNDNNVISVKISAAEGGALTADEIEAVTADLSELGLSSEFAIEPSLMEGTISCLNTVSAGEKTIPVTVKDIYGNIYKTETKVNVTERTKAAGDFDWDEAVIYFAVTDRFFDGNASNNNAYGVNDYDTSEKGGSSYHGGDFAGLNEKLDYLKDLGVNTIWITPIVENITEDQHDNDTDTATYGYHGYWASDFTKLNKHLGTEEEFKALLDAAHSKGMKIMVDVVLNHAGYGTEKYFNSILTDADGNTIKMLRDASNTISGDDKYDALSGLPDFVTENKEVADQLIEWQTGWMAKYDIDYYRVDTVKHVETTTWAAFKNSLTKVNPDFKMIGEYSGAGYANTAGELGTGTMDALLDFDFNDFAQSFVTGSISNVENSLQKRNAAINNTATMGSFLDSHDEDTLQYKLVNESKLTDEEAYNLMKVAATLQITAKGQPVLYYGDEIGQAGNNSWPLQTNRRDFDWEKLEQQKTDSNSMYNHYKTLLSIRNAYTDVFARGNRSTVVGSDEEGYEVISRSYGNDKLYVGMNIKEAEKEITVPVSEKEGTVIVNLYDGKEYTVSADQTIVISIPAAKDGGTIVLTAKKNETSDDDKKDDVTTPDDSKKDDVTTPDDSKKDDVTTPDESKKDDVTTPDESKKDDVTTPDESKKDDVTTPDTDKKDDVTTPDTDKKDDVTTPDESKKDDVTTPDESKKDDVTTPDESKKDDVTTPDSSKKDDNTSDTKQEEKVTAEVVVEGNSIEQLITTLKNTKEGGKVQVTLSEGTKVPADVFNTIKGKDVTVVLKAGNSVSWVINGKNIKGNITTPIDLGVKVGESSIPEDKVSELADGNKIITLSLNYDGEFGFDGTLRISVGAENSGKIANLYYYNEQTGKFEFYEAVTVNDYGTAAFHFSHASQYAIVLSDKDMSDTVSAVIASPKTSDNAPVVLAFFLLLVGCASMGAFYKKQRRY